MDAATASRERYLAIFELQLEARRRPALAAALARLTSVAVAFTTDEHAALDLSVPPEAIGTLMTLYGGALFVLVTGPGDVQPDAVRQIARPSSTAPSTHTPVTREAGRTPTELSGWTACRGRR